MHALCPPPKPPSPRAVAPTRTASANGRNTIVGSWIPTAVSTHMEHGAGAACTEQQIEHLSFGFDSPG